MKKHAKYLMVPVTVLAFAAVLWGCAAMDFEQLSEQERTFDKVYEAPEFSKEEIFNATKVWIAQNFRSAKAVIEHQDEEEGIIIGNGSMSYPCSMDDLSCYGTAGWKVDFTMRVDIKDEKFKLTFMNIMIDTPPGEYSSGNRFPINSQAQLDAIKPELLSYGERILESMKTDEAKSDW